MSQPYGKTGSMSGWSHNFLHSLTSFDFSQLNISAGIRAGVLITSLLIIGVFSNHVREATLAALGTIFFLQGRTKQRKILVDKQDNVSIAININPKDRVILLVLYKCNSTIITVVFEVFRE